MARARLAAVLLVLWASLRFIPSAVCAREAQDLWTDDRTLQLAMARAADRWRAQTLVAEDLMTSSARFDGEWLFGTYMMAALGYAQVAMAHPELAPDSVAAMDDCIEHMLTPSVRAFDRAAWGHDPLEDLGSTRAHAAYLGYLNLVLSIRRGLSAASGHTVHADHVQWSDRISGHLHDAMLRSPIGLAQTYPGEVYPVDNTAIIASLALHERATGIDHAPVLRAWDERFESLRDDATGLLVQSVAPGTAAVVDGPRGSGSALAVYFLSFGRPDQSKLLYDAVHTELHRTLLGFGATREYPSGVDGRGDIDSGPVVLGVSISATGFALAGSRIHGDAQTFAELWATTSLFGAPVDRDGTRHFALGGPLGDAMMFALLTARPATELALHGQGPHP